MTGAREAPTREAIALLPPFEGLPLARIVVPASPEACAQAIADLAHAQVVGFDTESKPTFKAGERSGGPHIVQFATAQRAYVFQLHRDGQREAVGELLESELLIKVGFGLKSDRSLLRDNAGIRVRAVLDLNTLFREQGYRSSLGVRSAVALVFQQRLQKSKRMTTSNWATPELKPAQLLYAANDAYAAIRVLQAMGTPREHWPIQSGDPVG